MTTKAFGRHEKGSAKWWLFLSLITLGAWHSHQSGQRHRTGNSSDITTEQIAQLASSATASDVLMYSTTECGYCTQAREWLQQHGFRFTECNMSVSQLCEQEFRALGADGTPYLIVRGHHMKNGFDSEEFLAALRDGT